MAASGDAALQLDGALLALAVALLWAVHPLQTETVTCVIQRTELLLGFFYLLTLYLFLRSVASAGPARWQVLPQAVLLVVLVAGTAAALWRRPALGWLGAWFFAILAPSSSVLPLTSETIAEHRMYLPLAAVIALGGAFMLCRDAGG